MAHSNNIISQVKLPGSDLVYEIHDAQAFHSLDDLGLSGVMVFKGTKPAVANLPSSGNKNGDVWYVTADDCEYVWTGSAWEALGNIHDAASSTHTHNIASLSGTNKASAVTGSVTVPTVTPTQKYLSVSAAAPSVDTTDDSVLGANTTFGATVTPSTTKLSASASGVAVGANGTAAAITGFGNHTTAAAITALNTTTIKNPTVTTVSIPNVTGNSAVTASHVTSSAGTAASWGASVVDGVLSFSWTTNTPTTVNATDVAASKVTLGTALSASSVTTSNVTVATGSKSTADAITALGAPTTANALTGVKVTAQPTVTLTSGASGDVSVATGIASASVTVGTNDRVSALTSAVAAAPVITVSEADATSTGAVPVVSAVAVGDKTASISGTAAAQTWTFGSGSTSQPK